MLRSSVCAFKCWLESDKNNGPLHVCLRPERGTLSVAIEKIIRTIIYEMLILIRGFKIKITEEYKLASNCTLLQESNVLDSCNIVQSAYLNYSKDGQQTRIVDTSILKFLKI